MEALYPSLLCMTVNGSVRWERTRVHKCDEAKVVPYNLTLGTIHHLHIQIRNTTLLSFYFIIIILNVNYWGITTFIYSYYNWSYKNNVEEFNIYIASLSFMLEEVTKVLNL